MLPRMQETQKPYDYYYGSLFIGYCQAPKPYKHCFERMSMAKTKEDIEKDIQEKYIQLQMLKQQATSLLDERNQLEEQVRELPLTTDAVKQIGAVKQGSEIWSPLGG